jgi:hypothetical protein
MNNGNFVRSKNKRKISSLLIVFVVICAWLLFLLLEVFNQETSYIMPALIISLLLIIITASTYKAYSNNDLFQPIMIVNIFVFFIFVARPIHIIWGDAILNDHHVFYIYKNIYGLGDVSNLPYSKALLVGLIGLLSVYIGYYISFDKGRISNSFMKRGFSYDHFLRSTEQIKSGIIFYRFFILVAGASCLLFFLRHGIKISNFSSRGISYGTIDIIWIHIGTVALIYAFLIRGKLKLGGWLLVLIYCVLVAVIAKRAYIVNLLLPILILSYYLRYKRNINIRLMLMGIGIIGAVLVYGSIRSSEIGRNISSYMIANVLSEFSMFDMLLVSINYEEIFGRVFYGGYNYLSIFNGILPSSIWPWKVTQFDHAHTAMIFKGLYGGAVPTSLFGSLYLNFSFIGIFIGGIIFGRLLKFAYTKIIQMDSRISIGIYALFTTFLYDIIRVGDIGREIWTFFVYIGVFYIMGIFVMRKSKL